MYVEAVFATALGLFSLTMLRFLDDKHRMRRKVELTFGEGPTPIELITQGLGALGAKVQEIDYHRDLGNHRTQVSFDALIPLSLGLQGFVNGVEKLPGLQDFQVRVP